jgi:hypothetical protein
MKLLLFSSCFTCIFLFMDLPSSGQTHMYLDDQFKSASQPIPAKRKGFSAVGKYEFGPYKIISGKEGWTTTKQKSEFLSGDTKIQSSTKQSFVFTGFETDTVYANVTETSVTQIEEHYGFVFRTLTNWSEQEITESSETYIAGFDTPYDTAAWNLILVYPVLDEIVGEITADQLALFHGMLTNGQIQIDVRPEFRWDNGKPFSILNPVEGYTFVLKGETIAAVQVKPINKMLSWIRNDIRNDLKLILAASSAALMVRSF